MVSVHEFEGEEYSFLEKIEDEYICNICSKLFTDPHLTECCGQHYCSACIDKWIHTNLSKACPQCRSPTITHILDKSLQRKICELKVMCTQSSQGCGWIGTLFDVQHHLNLCIYASIECSHGCGRVLRRKDITIHEEHCQLRLVQCEHCSNLYTFESLNSEHLPTCPKLPVSCEKCHEIIKQEQLKSHLKEECPKTVVISHGDLLEGFQKLTADMAELKLEMTSLRQERNELKTELKHMTDKLRDSCNVLSLIKAESSSTRSVLLSELQFLHSYQLQLPNEQLALECIKTQLRETDIHLKPNGKSATFRVSKYDTCKLMGNEWYSPSFYIPDGYRFCFAFHFNGLGAGEGTHTSLSLHLMKGKHDQALKWPHLLCAEIEIRLMNQTPAEKSPHIGKRNIFRKVHSPEQSPTSPKKGKARTLPLSVDRNLEHSFVYEKEILRVSSNLVQVTDSNIGPPIAKLELFCLQNTVEHVVYKNSLVFQISLNALSSTFGSQYSHSQDNSDVTRDYLL